MLMIHNLKCFALDIYTNESYTRFFFYSNICLLIIKLLIYIEYKSIIISRQILKNFASQMFMDIIQLCKV